LNGLNRQFRVDVLDYGADTSLRSTPTVNTPTTVTQFQSNNGTVKLVNNNPIGVQGTNTNSGIDFSNVYDGAADYASLLSQNFKGDRVLMHYYKTLPAVKKVETQGNLCPEISRGEYSEASGAYWIDHVNSCGKIYTYLNKNAMIKAKGEALNTTYEATFYGVATAALGGGIFSIIGFGYPVYVYNKLATDLDTCINLGAKSAWVDVYGGIVKLQVSCSY
jgi:hypothetical protein